MLLGIALAASEPIRSLFSQQEPKPVVHVVKDVQCPPHFYINVDERVWALRLM
jgi:hypothetical protein